MSKVDHFVNSALPSGTPVSSKWAARGFLANYAYEKSQNIKEDD